MDINAKIERLRQFSEHLAEYHDTASAGSRRYLNENAHSVRREVLEAGCLQKFTISPPPAIGGLVMQNVDAFDMMFNDAWGMSLNPPLRDMIDKTIGALKDWEASGGPPVNDVPVVDTKDVRAGFVFIAMPMDEGNPLFEDVHDAIKTTAEACGLNAERVDDVESNERITDRVLESIERAEFVIADLTDARPNVFYEAGYAHGLGKIPIYIAEVGTKLEFDLKDYPVITFRNMRELRVKLERRLRSIAERRS